MIADVQYFPHTVLNTSTQQITSVLRIRRILRGEGSSSSSSTSCRTRMPRKAKDEEEGGSTAPISRPPRHTSSKYDFVKVRVWLGENSDHYYVLSRFLVSRMLTVTKIPNHVAIKIALELKKLLIDNSLLDVSQSDLEANLFKLMERRGYGPEYIKRYEMMTRFHHQRIPLIILVCGAPCVGKSTIATQLAQRLNLPNVLQTDMVYELLRTATDAPLTSTPIWAREFSSPEQLITAFCRECRIIRKGLDGDLAKAIKDGKPVIIEGVHLDPSIYLMDEDSETGPALQKNTNLAPVEPNFSSLSLTEAKLEVGTIPPQRSPVISETESSGALESVVEDGDARHQSREETVPSEQENVIMESRRKDFPVSTASVGQTSEEEAPDSFESIPDAKIGQGIQGKPSSKPPTKVIVVPIVLRMDELDHQTLLEEWVTCRSTVGPELLQGTGALMSKLRIIQDYLCSFESQGMKVVNISATTFPQTLDWLHSYLLQCRCYFGISGLQSPERLHLLLQCIERGCATSISRTST